MQKLRHWFTLSHAIPLLVTLPLMGLVLLVVLENQVILPGQAKELRGEARLLAEFLGENPVYLHDPLRLQSMLDRTRNDLAARVMILNAQGQILTSSDPTDANRLGEAIPLPQAALLHQGNVVDVIQRSQNLEGEIVDVYAPITNSAGSIDGYVRLSYRFKTVVEEFVQLRYLIGGITFLALLGGLALGAIEASSLSRRLQKVAEALDSVAHGESLVTLPEQGPDEIRTLLRSFNYLVERLQAAQASRQHLLANLIHELGRPLGALQVSLDAVGKKPAPDPILEAELLQGMQGELVGMRRLLDDLSQHYEQASGGVNPERQWIDLTQWLPVTLMPWQQSAQSHHLAWEQNLPGEISPLYADALLLDQALGNLLSNAIKYTPSGGKIAVAVSETAQSHFLSVRDSGPGISIDEQEAIFTPLYRSAAQREHASGMGLGLSIARNLVVAHRGALTVESELGQGSIFTISLPKLPPADL